VTVNGISGSFPDYLPLIPKEAATIISFATASLLRGLQAGRLIGLQGNFSMKPKENGKGNVTLEVEGDNGEVEKNIEAMIKGEAQKICINLQYLRDAIEGCERLGYGGVYMSTLGFDKPLLIKPPEDKEKKKPGARFIVMPSMGNKKAPEAEKEAPAVEAVAVGA
jgi:DNA polymerase III sliding clamp (beta) subunit (PCNA family)